MGSRMAKSIGAVTVKLLPCEICGNLYVPIKRPVVAGVCTDKRCAIEKIKNGRDEKQEAVKK